MPRLARLIVLIPAFMLAACGNLRYYSQAARGQAELIVQRRSITSLLADPGTPPSLAARLQTAQQARRFATEQLGLPDNRSYTSYVELKRPYVVWNVFATPRFSVEPIRQCFPIAGCVAYRGYFSEAAADARAARLRQAGDDVWVGGVPAYSTLGWFADPILSSMMRWDDDELAATIFHELAHQLIYVKDDTAFNESFASFVQQQGLRQWRQSRGLPPACGDDQRADEAFTRLVLALRERLRKVYASGIDDASMLAAKEREIDQFRRRYQQWRDRGGVAEQRYDKWVAKPINNARLLPFGLYDQWTPAFAVLFQRAGESWPVFYSEVRALARLSRSARDRSLQTVMAEQEQAGLR